MFTKCTSWQFLNVETFSIVILWSTLPATKHIYPLCETRYNGPAVAWWWRHRSLSTLFQIIACFLTAPSQYLTIASSPMLTQWNHQELISILFNVHALNINYKNIFENYLTHWGRDKMDAFRRRQFQIDFFEWKYMNFDWSLFVRIQLTIFQHWCR